ncbi:DUF559 domain-containing protein [Escherichia coli]|uniref:DUF559 domain-containing protein n=3 Tax=Escherichia TaxID=561 RepID=UPI00191A945B|nr:DUF559 domain-containing protein [Escherichia coli]EHK5020177.1 DUF559 domain-containing protein [Escherichia coli]EHL0816387.1 DUF559 domain-containing protein [Escherichia coli]CAD6062730.1 Protein of uncharacterised function (DUF559) [Escherichia coli]
MDKIKANARDLRRNLTPQERKFWRYLRSRRFADFKFRRQHPVGNYILDFACCSARLAVELDGGQHDSAIAYDTRRTRWLESQGWTVLRFWNNEIDHNEEAVLGEILQELNRRSPSPQPSPQRGEGAVCACLLLG